jgi:hypothetical protein
MAMGTSRLVMNLVLLQHGYIIANIKGDYESRMRYYQTLETAQTKTTKKIFFTIHRSNRKESLERYLVLLVNNPSFCPSQNVKDGILVLSRVKERIEIHQTHVFELGFIFRISKVII